MAVLVDHEKAKRHAVRLPIMIDLRRACRRDVQRTALTARLQLALPHSVPVHDQKADSKL